MHFDRNAFLAAYQAQYGASSIEAEQAMRAVETAYAEKQNAEALQALDELQADVNDWKRWEALARGALALLAQHLGFTDGPVQARIQAGQYDEARAIIEAASPQD